MSIGRFGGIDQLWIESPPLLALCKADQQIQTSRGVPDNNRVSDGPCSVAFENQCDGAILCSTVRSRICCVMTGYVREGNLPYHQVASRRWGLDWSADECKSRVMGDSESQAFPDAERYVDAMRTAIEL